MKKLFRSEKFIGKMIFVIVIAVLLSSAAFLNIKASQNAGYDYGYYMPWGYYGYGYQYYNPSPVAQYYPDGTLVKVSGNANIYLLEIGEKRLIKSWTTFLSYGYSYSNVVTISSASLSNYPSGPDLYARKGTLLKVSGDAKIYVTDYDGTTYTKRWITDWAAFTAAGFSYSSVYTVGATELGWYTNGTDYDGSGSLPNGVLVKTAASPDVYLIDNGLKRHIVSATAFTSHNFSWSKIKTINAGALAGYSTGDPLRCALGTLLKLTGGTPIYIVDLVGGTYYKRHFTSWAAFTGRGFSYANVKNVAQSELDTYTDALTLS